MDNHLRHPDQADGVLTYRKLIEILSVLEGQHPPRALVGIACRPDICHRIRGMKMSADVAPGDPRKTLLNMLGTPVYEDTQQQEPWILFYDRALLRQYLNRNQPS